MRGGCQESVEVDEVLRVASVRVFNDLEEALLQRRQSRRVDGRQRSRTSGCVRVFDDLEHLESQPPSRFLGKSKIGGSCLAPEQGLVCSRCLPKASSSHPLAVGYLEEVPFAARRLV